MALGRGFFGKSRKKRPYPWWHRSSSGQTPSNSGRNWLRSVVVANKFRLELGRFQHSRLTFPTELGLLQPEPVKFWCASGKFTPELGATPFGKRPNQPRKRRQPPELVGRAVLCPPVFADGHHCQRTRSGSPRRRARSNALYRPVAESGFNTNVSTSVVNRVNPHNVAAASNQPPCCVVAYASSNPTHKGALMPCQHQAAIRPASDILTDATMSDNRPCRAHTPDVKSQIAFDLVGYVFWLLIFCWRLRWRWSFSLLGRLLRSGNAANGDAIICNYFAIT